jgi:uncharacterized tellurite resistance protein B-like protein
MARRKKDSAGGIALVIIGGIVAAVSAIPKEAWIVIAGLAFVGFIVWAVSKGNSTPTSVETKYPPAESHSETALEAGTLDNFRLSTRKSSESREAPKGEPVAPRWVPANQTIEVSGRKIEGGMVYFGSGIMTPWGDVEPALIEPRLPVSRSAPDVSQRQTEYWPSYSTISASARATYLSWLMSGRKDPQADVGYVFLFFYGLERRVLVDAPLSTEAKAELPAIDAEVRRLLSIYGSNRSLVGYATAFLEYLAAIRTEAGDGPPLNKGVAGTGLSAELKIGLGRLAVAGEPLHPEWALAWMRSDPRISIPVALTRCPDEFERLFRNMYAANFGAGFKLPVNKTRLRLMYRPASGGFRGQEISSVKDDLPDLTAVLAPVKRLECLAEECAKALAPYSRYVHKSPSESHSLEAILLLPRALWPDAARRTIEEVDQRLGDGLKVTTLGEVSTSLGGSGTLTRDKVRALAHALEEMCIGVEPDVLAGARTPKPDDAIILFRSDVEDASLRESAAYQAASVSLDLACSVAMADGKPHPNELQLLMKQIDGWAQLSTAQRKRLRARLRMSIESPPTLASLKSKLEVIPANGKRAIGHLLATLAQADGTVSPSEVKLLEKIYKALGLDAQSVYTDLHVVSAPTPPPASSAPVVAAKGRTTSEAKQGVNLDMARIAALQRETAEVSAMLAGVFSEPAVPSEVSEERDEAASIIEPGPLGLDPEHAVFLRMLLTRPSWSRQELADAAADMELMLDGAIERINEAAFEHLDAALLEGEDPVEIVRDVMEQVPA